MRLACAFSLVLIAAAASVARAQLPASVQPAASIVAPIYSLVPMPPGSSPAPSPAPVPAAPVPAPMPSAAIVAAEAAQLQTALGREVPHLLFLTPEMKQQWIARARAELAVRGFLIDRPELMVVVDRNPRVQELCLILAQPSDAAWEVIGGTHVSTGQTGRFDHYITPVGVFLHDGSILDYRAEGTFNENHIRGLGLKGSRVWDFGWQWAAKGWRPDSGQIRLLLHATDPVLEPRIGHPASDGCIRIPATLNRFLDRHAVLDADYDRLALTEIRFRALLLQQREPTPLAGDVLVVIDSGSVVQS
jgi:hypothetical protein